MLKLIFIYNFLHAIIINKKLSRCKAGCNYVAISCRLSVLIIIIIIINLLAQKHDKLNKHVPQNISSGTARTLMPLIAAIEKYK